MDNMNRYTGFSLGWAVLQQFSKDSLGPEIAVWVVWL